MKIVCKHNGTILNEYGYDSKTIENITELNEENIQKIKDIVSWRKTDKYDFEYGIGGHVSDEYYKIKNISFANNDTEIIVKVSKV